MKTKIAILLSGAMLVSPVFSADTTITTTTTTVISGSENQEETPVTENSTGAEDNSDDAETPKKKKKKKTAKSSSTESSENVKRESAPDSYELQLKITRLLRENGGLEKNHDSIALLAPSLSLEQRFLLLEQNKKDATTPFLLNFLIGMGVGSFVQGDNTGGWTGLLGELGSIAIMLGGSVFAMNSGYYPLYYVTLIGGCASYLGFRIYEFIRPWTYATEFNGRLGETLRVALHVEPLLILASNAGTNPSSSRDFYRGSLSGNDTIVGLQLTARF